jgi:hypothetical protein
VIRWNFLQQNKNFENCKVLCSFVRGTPEKCTQQLGSRLENSAITTSSNRKMERVFELLLENFNSNATAVVERDEKVRI